MAHSYATVYAGGEGTIKVASGIRKGLRNHRSQKSPKALLAIAERRRKRALEMRNKFSR